jgi:hypothetical protein
MSRPFKIDALLSDADHAEAKRLALHRQTTVDVLHIWLKRKQYQVSRGAAWTWMRHLREQYSPAEQLRADLQRRLGQLPPEQLQAVADLLDALPPL